MHISEERSEQTGWREIKATQSFLLNVPRLLLNGFEGRFFFPLKHFQAGDWGGYRNPKEASSS